MNHRGFTLIEMLVALTILSIVLGTSALASRGAPSAGRDSRTESLRQARTRAIESGRAVTAGGASRPVLFLPDGRAIGAGVDPLTGQVE